MLLISSGIIFILIGLIMYNFPPKKINPFYGYRTWSSMKNQESWDFTQQYASLEMIKVGIIMCLGSALSWFFIKETKMTTKVGVIFLILLTILLVVRVERAIKSKFDV